MNSFCCCGLLPCDLKMGPNKVIFSLIFQVVNMMKVRYVIIDAKRVLF